MNIGNIIDILSGTTDIWVPVVAAIFGWLAKSKITKSLPAGARDWLGRIGEDNLIDTVATVDAVADATPAERRQMAVERLQKEVRERWELNLPTSIANLLVEYAYQLYKRARR